MNARLPEQESMSNKMLIDASHREETRVVVVKGNRLEDFDFESEHKKQIRGNIYLAKVTRVEPSLQAAFVDYGGNRHGFLAFSEIHPDYYQIPLADRQALLAEEERLAEQEDDEQDNGDGENRRSRRRRGGRKSRGGKRDAAQARGVPDAEPVAMEAILADWEAREAEAAESDDEDEDDSPDIMAARAEHEDDNVISDTPSEDDEDGDTAEADSSDEDGNGGSRRKRGRGRRRGKAARGRSSNDDADYDNDEDDDSDEDDEIDTVGSDDAMEEARPRQRAQRRQYKIQEVIKRRQIILVQVVKEERGNKGAALTTYLSLAGRYSVLMPNTARGGGISRKITNAADRKRLKDIVKESRCAEGHGRHPAHSRRKPHQAGNQARLRISAASVGQRARTDLASTAPALVYEEGSLIKRSIRDLYNKDIDEVLSPATTPTRGQGLHAHADAEPCQERHRTMARARADVHPTRDRERSSTQCSAVRHGCHRAATIVINQTEALVAVDVNSGRSTREFSIEETALKTNLEAADEVARQLRCATSRA
jgi:ribonuclease E